MPVDESHHAMVVGRENQDDGMFSSCQRHMIWSLNVGALLEILRTVRLVGWLGSPEGL